MQQTHSYREKNPEWRQLHSIINNQSSSVQQCNMFNLLKHSYEGLLACTILTQKGEKRSLANLSKPQQSCQGAGTRQPGSPPGPRAGHCSPCHPKRSQPAKPGWTQHQFLRFFSFSISCVPWRALLQLPVTAPLLCLLRGSCTNFSLRGLTRSCWSWV